MCIMMGEGLSNACGLGSDPRGKGVAVTAVVILRKDDKAYACNNQKNRDQAD